MTKRDWDKILTQLAEFWWIWLPLEARRLSAIAAVTLVDGLYLLGWPRIAGAAPLVALLAGLLVGWGHLGFTSVFSESLLVLALAVLLGVMSGNLGAAFLVGFVFGDFFLAHTAWTGGLRFWDRFPIWEHLLRIRIPLLIEYGLLGFLTMSIPILTKGLLVQISLPPTLSRNVRFSAAVVGHAVLTYLLVFFWVQTMPVLIRPIFVWAGHQPPVEAMAPLQRQGMVIVLIAVLASLARMRLQGLAATVPALAARLTTVEQQLESASAIQPLTVQVRPWVRTGLGALWSTLLLAGIYQTWLDGVALGALILLLQSARAGLVRIPLGPWPELVERWPLLIRLAAGLLVIILLSRYVVPQSLLTTESFSPIMILTGLAFVFLYLLNPGRKSAMQQPAAGTNPS
jgi:hypothetical protein